jgi:hypothetical protein
MPEVNVGKEIILTKNMKVIVDSEDFAWLSNIHWQAAKGHDTYYASSSHGLMHRLLFPDIGTNCIDHLNGNGLDNRKCNLRIATKAQNAMNIRKEKLKGITRHGEKWVAQIMINGKSEYLGIFDTNDEAALEYDQAAYRFFGEFASVNFPEIPHDSSWEKRRRKGSSNFRGVSRNYNPNKNAWTARSYENSKVIHIGNFPTELEAANAYDRVQRGYSGNLLRLNFPARFIAYG